MNARVVGRLQFPEICFVRRLEASVSRGRRGVEAAVHIYGRVYPETVKVRELPTKQPRGLEASGHAAFLD